MVQGHIQLSPKIQEKVTCFCATVYNPALVVFLFQFARVFRYDF